MFRSISADEFDSLLASARASPAFREEFARYEFPRHPRQYLDAVVQEGLLRIEGTLKVPAFWTLVLGDLEVTGTIDMRSRWESAGLFIVIGDLRCRNFLGEHEQAVFVDGDVTVDEALVTEGGDAFSVIGTLRAHLLFANDRLPSAGSGALIEYGIGACYQLGNPSGSDTIKPRHSRAATLAGLSLPPQDDAGYPSDLDRVGEAIRAGRSLFK